MVELARTRRNDRVSELLPGHAAALGCLVLHPTDEAACPAPSLPKRVDPAVSNMSERWDASRPRASRYAVQPTCSPRSSKVCTRVAMISSGRSIVLRGRHGELTRAAGPPLPLEPDRRTSTRRGGLPLGCPRCREVRSDDRRTLIRVDDDAGLVALVAAYWRRPRWGSEESCRRAQLERCYSSPRRAGVALPD